MLCAYASFQLLTFSCLSTWFASNCWASLVLWDTEEMGYDRIQWRSWSARWVVQFLGQMLQRCRSICLPCCRKQGCQAAIGLGGSDAFTIYDSNLLKPCKAMKCNGVFLFKEACLAIYCYILQYIAIWDSVAEKNECSGCWLLRKQAVLWSEATLCRLPFAARPFGRGITRDQFIEKAAAALTSFRAAVATGDAKNWLANSTCRFAALQARSIYGLWYIDWWSEQWQGLINIHPYFLLCIMQ